MAEYSELIERLRTRASWINFPMHGEEYPVGDAKLMYDAADVIEELISEAKPVVHGKWTDAVIAADNLYDRLGMMSQIRGHVCNCCQEFSVARYKYCPNCGAKMDAEREEKSDE